MKQDLVWSAYHIVFASKDTVFKYVPEELIQPKEICGFIRHFQENLE